MMTRKERIDLLNFVLDVARKSGAQSASARLSTRRSVAVEVREGQIDKLQESTARGLTATLYVDGRFARYSTQNLDRENLKTFLADAAVLTRHLGKDAFRRLPEPELCKLEKVADLQLRDKAYENVDPKSRIAMAKAAEAAARTTGGANLVSASASYRDTLSQFMVLTSTGFQGEEDGTSYSISAETTIKDGEKGRPEEFAWHSARHLSDLKKPEEVGQEAARRTLARLGAQKLPSGPFDLVVENRVAANLLGGILDAMSAGSIQQKNSFLDGKVGQKVGSPLLTIVDDPFLPKGMGSGLFDGETLALHKRVLIEGGILKSLLVDNYYGRKLGLTPNSGDTSNLLLTGGKGSLDELVKALGRGILVTSFIGGNVNGTTGDFSYGLMGQLVENGKIVRPVNEMNLSGNMLDLWSRLERVGGDAPVESPWRIPSLLFRGLQLSGA